MRIQVLRFNTNFVLRLAFSLLTALSCLLESGCASEKPKPKEPPNKYSKHDEASLRFYLEVNPDGQDDNGLISVGREHALQINVAKTSFLSEFNVEKATVVEALGGYSISVKFNADGRLILEQYSTAYKGKHVAIAAEFGQLRWLAAPIITHRITDGIFVFTPDATREESDRIVSGVNRVAELVKSGRK